MLFVRDKAALRIWIFKLNFSDSGKPFASLYILFLNSRAALYTSQSSKLPYVFGCGCIGITNYGSPITNYRLPITNYQLPITAHRIFAASSASSERSPF